MKKINIVFAAIALTGMISCGDSSSAGISGTIKNAEGKQIIFEKISNQNPVPVDTVKLDKEGKFHFDLPAGKKDFYRLNFGENQIIVLCTDSTENTEITADGKDIRGTYDIKNSTDSKIIRDFFNAFEPINKKRIELENKSRGINFADTALITSMRNEMTTIYKQVSDLTHSYIDKYKTSAALIILIDFLNPETDIDYLKKIEKAIGTAMPNSTYHNHIATKVSQLEYQLNLMKEQQAAMNNSLKAGVEMQDIVLPNPEGKVMKLSDLKGKVVLIDFWASWCRPCRAENPNVVKLYKQYKSKGFEVFSVSLDKEKEDWKKAIADDGLVWPNHVSDLGHWNSIVVKQFGINSIPFTVLIGKDGKIIDKGLKGEQLAAKLEELL